tara:strand:- start:106 stop:852 length:747 start_codon:yes stop_codon:yes gene_type:complete
MGVKCDKIIIHPKDTLTLLVTGGTGSIVEQTVKGDIVCLDLPDKRSLCLESVLDIRKVPYKINRIEKKYTNNVKTYQLIVANRTKSSKFLPPMLVPNKTLLMYNTQFVNAFIADGKHSNCICMLYRFSGDPLFLKFEQALKQFRNFLDAYDPSPYFVMFVFSVPEQHKQNYEAFVTGKYSEFDPDFKMQILDFHGVDISHQLGHIMFKAENRRLRMIEELGIDIPKGSELYSIIDIEDETFNPKIYIK